VLEIKNKDIAAHLKLPPVKLHCRCVTYIGDLNRCRVWLYEDVPKQANWLHLSNAPPPPPYSPPFPPRKHARGGCDPRRGQGLQGEADRQCISADRQCIGQAIAHSASVILDSHLATIHGTKLYPRFARFARFNREEESYCRYTIRIMVGGRIKHSLMPNKNNTMFSSVTDSHLIHASVMNDCLCKA
jgi:hypothetical protein